jgi:hypothetical protein
MAAVDKRLQVSESIKAVTTLISEANNLEYTDTSAYSGHLILADAQLTMLGTVINEDFVKHPAILKKLHGRNWAGDVRRSVGHMFTKYAMPTEQAALATELANLDRHAAIINEFVRTELRRVVAIEELMAVMSKYVPASPVPTVAPAKAAPTKKKTQKPITFFF